MRAVNRRRWREIDWDRDAKHELKKQKVRREYKKREMKRKWERVEKATAKGRRLRVLGFREGKVGWEKVGVK